MKKVTYILASAALFSMSLVGCTDLDTSLSGSIISEATKDSTQANFPSKVEAGVNAVFAQFSQLYPGMGTRYDNDFGYPGLMIMMDSNGQDMGCQNTGYSWFQPNFLLSDRVYTSSRSEIMWNTLYKQIKPANTVVAMVDPKTTDPVQQIYLGNALAARAFNYWVLAQLYQFNYAGNEDKPCVPLLTDKNSAEVAEKGAKRATVKEVYAQIMEDLNTSISLLTSAADYQDGSGNQPYLDADNAFTAGDHRYINLAVAYGLRARANLTMQNWKEAANDATKAIELEQSYGMTKTPLHDGNMLGYDVNDWMWGIKVNSTDDVVQTGIINWPSHFCTFYAAGYGSASSLSGNFQINEKLYDEIPATDIRKGWWLDASGKSKNLTSIQQSYITDCGYAPYTHVKFSGYEDIVGSQVAANNVPLMRIEEMYLIKAEGEAMGENPGTGKATLENFVKTFRDPSYTCTASSATDIQDAIWQQRRIEFWGEGLSWFDIMRLNKGVNRVGGGFFETAVYNIAPKSDIMLWRIPEAEIEANQLLENSDNNPAAPTPKPVTDNASAASVAGGVHKVSKSSVSNPALRFVK